MERMVAGARGSPSVSPERVLLMTGDEQALVGLFERWRKRRRLLSASSIKVFFGDERRRSSREIRLGIDWRSASDPDGLYTVFWLEDTGELYAMRNGRRSVILPGSGELLDHLKFHQPRRPEVEVLGHLSGARFEQLKAVLDPIAARNDPDGIGWLRLQVWGT
jgi:hypothetical protein